MSMKEVENVYFKSYIHTNYVCIKWTTEYDCCMRTTICVAIQYISVSKSTFIVQHIYKHYSFLFIKINRWFIINYNFKDF